MILQDPIETGEHRGDRSGSIAVKNAYRNESRRCRHPVIGSADDARDMGSMTITVGRAAVVRKRTEARANPAAEIGVQGDAGIHDIDSHAGASSVAHITAVEWERALIDSIQSPWRGGDGDSGILFDKLHA